MVEYVEAASDKVITHNELTSLMTTMFNTAIGGMVLALGMVMFNKVIGDNPGNPGNPGNPYSSETGDIIARARLKEYEYKWFPGGGEEERKHRVYPYTRTKEIGSYAIQIVRTDGTCTIKLYEYLSGWRKKLRATWTGFEKAECEIKFEQVCEVVRQVRFERKTQLMR